MKQNLKLLIIEDMEDDALLTVYKLTSAGFNPEWKRVETEHDLLRELREHWDVIISDYAVPNYSALNGLLIVRDIYPDMPFIIVSGAIGEEAAVELMRKGADDYLLKNNLGKLPQVIRRELEDYKLKIEKRKAEIELRESEERYSLALNSSEEGIWDWNLITGVKKFSPGYFQMLGIDVEMDPAPPDFKYELIHPEDKNFVMSAIRECVKGDKNSFLLEYRVKHTNGKWLWILGKCRVVNRNSDGSASRMVGTNLDITKNKMAEIERRESEERLKTLVDTIPDGILVVGINYIVKWANKNLLSLLHLDDYDDVIGKNLFPEVIIDPKGRVQTAFTKCLSNNKHQFFEFELNRMNGTRIFVEFSISLIHNYRSEPEYFMMVMRDITDRKSHESTIKKFSVAINASSDTIFITDPGGAIEYVNPAFEKVYGHLQEEVVGKTPRVLKSGEYGNDYYLKMWMTILAGKTFRSEMKNKRNDGTFVWEDRSISPIKNEAGDIVNFISVGRDISDRIYNEKHIRESEQKFKGIFEQSYNYSAIISRDGILSDINNSFLEFAELKKEEIMGVNFFDSLKTVAPSDIKQRLVASVEAALANKPHSFEWARVSGNGKTFIARFSVQPIKDDSGEITFMLIQGIDISEQKRSQESLLESERKFETLISNLPSAVYRCKYDENFTMEYMSKTTTALFGYSPEDFVQNKTIAYADVIHPEDREYVAAVTKNALEIKKPFTYEYKIVTKDNQVKWVHEQGRGVYDSDGKLIALEGIVTDITEKKKILEELISAKNAAEELNNLKNTLMANVSHELRTPLVGLLGYSEFLSEQLTGYQKECADLIHGSGARLLNTLSDLLDFSNLKKQLVPVEYRNVNLDKIVKEESELYSKNAEKKGLRIITELSSKNLYVLSDEYLLRQVIDNLLDNAIKFTESGTINVILSGEGNHAVIKVIDTGIGIPPEKCEMIFDEFRQVSEGSARVFQGLGLGLTLVKKNLHAINGAISVSSEVNTGSIFTVVLPLDRNIETISEDTKEELKVAMVETGKDNTVERKKLLLVEDDKINRSILTLMLQNHYLVDSVVNADGVFQIVKEKDFDVILMDINLGEGKNGAEVALELRQSDKYRNKPIIALTAYALPEERESFLRSGCSHYLAKPFKSADLLGLLNTIFSINDGRVEVLADYN